MASVILVKYKVDSRGAVKGQGQIVAGNDRVTSSTAKATGGFGALKTAVAAFMALAIVQQLGRMAVELFNIGTEAEETASKFNTVFGPAASALDAQLKSFANTAGLTQTEIRGIAATLGSVLQGMGLNTEAAAVYADEVLRLSADLASFNNIPIEQTSRAITAALTGEREQLKRLGIVIREVDVQERALAETGKTVASELTQQERAVATLALVTEKAGVANGDLERTQDSLANKTRNVGAVLRELKETFAITLMPVFRTVVSEFADFASSEAFQDRLKAIFAWVASVAGTLVQMGKAILTVGETLISVAGPGGEMTLFILAGDNLQRLIENITSWALRGAIAFRHMGRALTFTGLALAKAFQRDDLVAGFEESLEGSALAIQGIRDQLAAIQEGRELREMGGVLADVETTTENLVAELDDLVETLDELEIKAGNTPGLTRLKTELEEAAAAVRDFSDFEAEAVEFRGPDVLTGDDLDQSAAWMEEYGEMLGTLRVANAVFVAETEAEYLSLAEGVEIGMNTAADSLRFLFEASGQQSKAAFMAHKLVSIAGAIIDAHKAYTLALASAPPPFNVVLAGFMLARGLAAANAIRQTEIGATGAGASVGGGGVPTSTGTAATTPTGANSTTAGVILPGPSPGVGGGQHVTIEVIDELGFVKVVSQTAARRQRARGNLKFIQ